MSNSKTKISAPKGRPMLNWVGKQPLDYIKSFPAQLVETFNPIKSPLGRGVTEGDGVGNLSFKSLEHNWQNLLFHGDNKEILGSLLNDGFRGKIDLIYIDPPFDSGADYIRKIELRGVKDKIKIEGEDYNYLEQTQYFDIWNQDGYLQFMYERLQLMSELLNNSGFLFLHCDYHRGHSLKLVLDEVFGNDNFRNEIVVKRVQKNFVEGEYVKSMNNAYDTIFLYSKSNTPKFLPPRDHSTIIESAEENWHNFEAPNWSGGRPNLYYELFGQYPSAGNVWRWTKERAIQSIKDGTLRKNPSSGKPEYLVLNNKGAMVNNLWSDILAYSFKEDYPTEKSEKLLTRIIEICSADDSIILDCFIGSGTTAAVAQKLGRRWIGCDINKGAIQTTSKRLQKIISEQIEDLSRSREEKKKHPELFQDTSPRLLGEGQGVRSFAHYKVNDYDLQLLRTEAIELAVQHLGIQRSKTETFFDGTLGKTLVKLIDFNHPLTLLDLQQIQDELKKRPKEQRDITVACLGRELTTEPWVEEYNKKHPVNKLQIIELRTDSKYGKFLIHQPAVANVAITRIAKEKKCKVEIKDFISPTILERLNLDENLFKVKIPDFRSMIDVVLIDNNYDGSVFNIVNSDVPEKKNDLINGTYEIDLPDKDSTIAVKIIDMLGEEVLVIK